MSSILRQSRLALLVLALATLAGCAGGLQFEPLANSNAGYDADPTANDSDNY